MDIPTCNQWFECVSTFEIKRPFVLHKKNEFKRILICKCLSRKSNSPRLSVIIPTLDADRGGYFKKLFDQIARQNFECFEVIVVKGDNRQGRAINIGASLAIGEYLLTLDDDASLPDKKTFFKLVSAMDANPDFGIAGGNNVIPKKAKGIVKKAMSEIPRRSWDPVQEVTESDLAEHPCMIMRLSEFKAVGGENELMPRGLDPYLREKFREHGKKIVLIPNVVYHHLPPAELSILLGQFFRNGKHAAFANLHYPEWVYETPAHHGPFIAKRPLPYRLLRFLVRMIKVVSKGKFLFFCCELSYSFGFIKEYFFPTIIQSDEKK